MGCGWFRTQRMESEIGSQPPVVTGSSSNERPVSDIADLIALLIRRLIFACVLCLLHAAEWMIKFVVPTLVSSRYRIWGGLG